MYCQLRFLEHGNSRQTHNPTALVLAVALLACIAVCSSQDFTSNPEDVTVSWGDTFTLACVTRPGLAGQTVFWKRGGVLLFPLSNYPTYSTEGDASAGDYSLTIRDATSMESNSWSCQVSGVESSIANVTVNVFKGVLGLEQHKDGVTFSLAEIDIVNLTEEDDLIIIAVISNANPPADIAFFIKTEMSTTAAVPVNSSYVNTESIESNKLWNTTSTLNMTVQSDHNGAEITCRATHVTLSHPIEITVPLNVTFAPFVPAHLTLSNITIDIIQGSLEISIQIKGNPEPVITWVIEGHNNQTGKSLEVHSGMAGNHSCWATNAIGEVSCGTFIVEVTVWILATVVVVLILVVGVGVGVTIYCCKKKRAVSQDMTVASRSSNQVELQEQAAEKRNAKEPSSDEVTITSDSLTKSVHDDPRMLFPPIEPAYKQKKKKKGKRKKKTLENKNTLPVASE